MASTPSATPILSLLILLLLFSAPRASLSWDNSPPACPYPCLPPPTTTNCPPPPPSEPSGGYPPPPPSTTPTPPSSGYYYSPPPPPGYFPYFPPPTGYFPGPPPPNPILPWFPWYYKSSSLASFACRRRRVMSICSVSSLAAVVLMFF